MTTAMTTTHARTVLKENTRTCQGRECASLALSVITQKIQARIIAPSVKHVMKTTTDTGVGLMIIFRKALAKRVM